MSHPPVITFLDAYTLNPGDLSWDVLNVLGDFRHYDRTDPPDFEERVSETEILIVNKFPVNSNTLTRMPKLKYVTVAATGYNNIDADAMRSSGIPVSNVSGYSTDSVAQHVFSFILGHFNRIDAYSDTVKQGDWSACPDFCYYHHSIRSLKGQVLGIYGFGTIGRRVGELGQAFGMKIIATTANMNKEKPDYVRFVSSDDLFAHSDVLSLHAPLTGKTRYVVNMERLNQMKKSAILINTSRGPLVNEIDLNAALDQNSIAAAYLDVMEKEPPDASNPLLRHPRCIITPHIAWAGLESREQLLNGLADNIRHYLSGEVMNRVV
jgi:glycerate dehydrogenase